MKNKRKIHRISYKNDEKTQIINYKNNKKHIKWGIRIRRKRIDLTVG